MGYLEGGPRKYFLASIFQTPAVFPLSLRP